MSKDLLLSVLFCITSVVVKSQCTGCAINFSCTISPAFPTLCPVVMPDATAGQYYEEDMTFWLPANFDDPDTGFNVDFQQMTITNVQGLPFGLEYTPNQVNGIYFPQIDEYGCARICGTALSPGNYSVTISVMVEVTFNGITITLPQQFILPITVLPGTGGNSSFTFTPTSGCDSVCADFTALIDGTPLPTEYTWVFSSGDTLAGAMVNHCFTDSGSNYISLQTDIYEYVITDLFIDGVNDNWCGDVEEPDIFGCTLAPDLYFVVTDGSGNTVYTSSAGTDSEDEEWHNLNIVLNDPPYSIQFWDEDLISGDDPLGTFNLTTVGAGTYPYNVAGGTNGSVIVGTQLFQSFFDQDSVVIFPTPSVALANDSIANTLAMPVDDGLFHWFQNGDTIPFESDSLINLGDPGLYWVNVATAFGCSFVSDTFTLCPTVLLSVDTTIGLLSVSGNYSSYQWFMNGVVINGATDPFLIISSSGTYWVEVTTDYGCVEVSDSYMDATGIADNAFISRPLDIFPSPGSGLATIVLPTKNEGVTQVRVFDMRGAIVAQRGLFFAGGKAKIDLRHLAPGHYILTVETDVARYTGRYLMQPQ